MFRDPLKEIVDNCDGALAAIVMGFDGIAVEVVSADDKVETQTISMEFSFVLTQVRKAAELLDVGDLQEVAIRSDGLTFVVRVLSEEYFLAIVMEPTGNYGKGRFLMRMATPELRSQL